MKESKGNWLRNCTKENESEQIQMCKMWKVLLFDMLLWYT